MGIPNGAHTHGGGVVAALPFVFVAAAAIAVAHAVAKAVAPVLAELVLIVSIVLGVLVLMRP